MVDLLSILNSHYPWLIPLWGALFGAVIGSFINCVRVRLPAGESLRYPPSKCDACQYTLTTLDLVPIFSYLFLRGQCRKCGIAIGQTSLYVECLAALVGAIVFFCITWYL